jgi:hypothetical protein
MRSQFLELKQSSAPEELLSGSIKMAIAGIPITMLLAA